MSAADEADYFKAEFRVKILAVNAAHAEAVALGLLSELIMIEHVTQVSGGILGPAHEEEDV